MKMLKTTLESFLFASMDGVLFWAAIKWFQMGSFYVAACAFALGIGACLSSHCILRGAK